MSLTLLPTPEATEPRAPRVPARFGRTASSALDLVAAGSGRLAILVARLIGWFAADPRRARAAAIGLGVSATVGVAVGAGAGLLAARLADALRSFVDHLTQETG